MVWFDAVASRFHVDSWSPLSAGAHSTKSSSGSVNLDIGNTFYFLQCGIGGCMYELSFQLLIYMVGNMLWGNIIEFFIPWIKNRCRLVRLSACFAFLVWTTLYEVVYRALDGWSSNLNNRSQKSCSCDTINYFETVFTAALLGASMWHCFRKAMFFTASLCPGNSLPSHHFLIGVTEQNFLHSEKNHCFLLVSFIRR